MTSIERDLESFRQFAVQVLAGGSEELTMEDLVREWRAEREREETLASIRRGIADADAGRVHDLAEVDASIRAELGFRAKTP